MLKKKLFSKADVIYMGSMGGFGISTPQFSAFQGKHFLILIHMSLKFYFCRPSITLNSIPKTTRALG